MTDYPHPESIEAVQQGIATAWIAASDYAAMEHSDPVAFEAYGRKMLEAADSQLLFEWRRAEALGLNLGGTVRLEEPDGSIEVLLAASGHPLSMDAVSYWRIQFRA